MDWLTDALKEELLTAGKRQAEADARAESCALPILTCLRLSGSSWLLASVCPDDPDMAYGLCHVAGGVPELGYIRLSELAGLRNSNGIGVFEDPMFKNADRLDVRRYADMAAITGQIALHYTY
ncbi:DUF2958 domain-containing protein [Sphingobium sp. PNB]|uniref:DUF2958 domain-containing protein n=1 Tax=Sphingobium sp. PNB TaxID=863934 RepID=UPI001CA40362|nr:DUF2958 domain-containing protein [Sphingobium sp. PNB]MCB4859591.1 DUF2958 domain-containing protein [Sphingobium sp. PNB]